MQRRQILGTLTATTTALLGPALLGAPAQASTTASRLPALYPGAITDVKGVKVGHFTDDRRPTGCTVILTEAGATGGVDVRGSAPGTRETDLLNPTNLVEKVNAVLLSGGSAFGLEAATGVVRYLEERKIGYPVGAAGVVPIVPAAILFDLGLGDPRIRPDATAGYKACEAATDGAFLQGSVGAGTGASIGKLWGMARAMKGGLGTASVRVGGITLGAIVAVNAVGDVLDPTTGRILAGARTEDGQRFQDTVGSTLKGQLSPGMRPGTATTIGVMACDARLTKAQCQKLAQIAHDGLARTINPVHTHFDGDTIFALATGASELTGNMLLLGVLAAEVMSRAVVNAIVAARGWPALPAAAEFRA
jgi:L-aminopeptidase/D-esterase-like protein